MVRLQIVSGAIMFVSLMAVFGAVVYKAMHSEPKETASTVAASGVPSDAPLAATVSLPLGFKVQSTSFSAGQILFYGETVEGKSKALVYDLRTGRTVADVTVAGN
jgi:putative copper export protein